MNNKLDHICEFIQLLYNKFNFKFKIRILQLQRVDAQK